MSLWERARVIVIVGDYIAADGTGKLGGLGVAFTSTPIIQTGNTAPMTVAAIIDLPSSAVGQTVDVSFELYDLVANRTAQVPSADGQLGALRVQSPMQFAAIPPLPGYRVPDDMFTRGQMVIGFPTGVPLTPGRAYEWRVQINGERRVGWAAQFLVAELAPPLVWGGPAGASDIPEVGPNPTEHED